MNNVFQRVGWQAVGRSAVPGLWHQKPVYESTARGVILNRAMATRSMFRNLNRCSFQVFYDIVR
jgi:hypothetical protein